MILFSALPSSFMQNIEQCVDSNFGFALQIRAELAPSS